jgi:uncharacterized glyoxalase superfamily protein PhnB
MKKLTPVLLVEEVAAALPFWIDRLGFETQFDVVDDPSKPAEGQPLGFVSLRNGDVEVMLQSRESMRLDAPEQAEGEFSCTGIGLFIEVEDLNPIIAALEGYEIAIPVRETFYGMRESSPSGKGRSMSA